MCNQGSEHRPRSCTSHARQAKLYWDNKSSITPSADWALDYSEQSASKSCSLARGDSFSLPRARKPPLMLHHGLGIFQTPPGALEGAFVLERMSLQTWWTQPAFRRIFRPTEAPEDLEKDDTARWHGPGRGWNEGCGGCIHWFLQRLITTVKKEIALPQESLMRKVICYWNVILKMYLIPLNNTSL